MHRHGVSPAATQGVAAYLNPQDRPPAFLHCRHHICSHRRALTLCQLTGPGALHRLHQLQHLGTPYRSHLRCIGRKHPRRHPIGRRLSLVQDAHQVAAAVGQGLGKLHLAVRQGPEHQRLHPQLRDPQRHPAAHSVLLPPDQLLPEPPTLR